MSGFFPVPLAVYKCAVNSMYVPFNLIPLFSGRKIVERIDTNGDGYINHKELHLWIKHRQRRYIEENVNKHWNEYDLNKDGLVAWHEYKNITYGYYLSEYVDVIWRTIPQNRRGQRVPKMSVKGGEKDESTRENGSKFVNAFHTQLQLN